MPLRTLITSWLLICCFAYTTSADDARPNIVTVLIDDMGYSDLSSFGGEVETTNIDRLANEGIRFTNFYVNSPICSPSRTALTTGQYPQRWRITSFLNHRQSNQRRGMAQWLDPRAPVLARQLREAGYFAGHFGKWHMGGQRDVGDAPLVTEYGFDHSLTNFEGLGPRVLGFKNSYDGSKPALHDLGSNKLGRGPIETLDRSRITGRFVERAIQHIDQAVAKGQPFFVNVWPDDVHSPFFPPEVLRDATDESKRQLYLAVLKAMDDQLGQLFDRIRGDRALLDNTLIVVCSDNGHEPGAGRSDPLRGSKGFLYEGGIRSPLIVWGPGLVQPSAAGSTNEQSVFSAIDINRSLYELTHIPVPSGVTLDGEDVLETMLGKSQAGRQSPIFFRRPPDRPHVEGGAEPRGKKQRTAAEPIVVDAPDLAVRDGKWKFLINLDKSDPQLYDLSVDAGESGNVVDRHPDVAKRLERALFDWNATMPRDAGDPTYDHAQPVSRNQFVNPIGEGADPWVIRDPNENRYLWCMSEGNTAIAIHTSQTPTSLGTKQIVWRAPDSGMVSKQVWAPELHFLDGRWHVYFAASDGDNANHLAYVLVSKTADPLGEYALRGPFFTGEAIDENEAIEEYKAEKQSPNLWAIDMTVLEHGGQRYAIWSGWDEPGSDQQYLYIAPMRSPVALAGPRVRICANDDFPWEFTEGDNQGRGLNEAPQVLKNNGRTFLTYSCGGSWLPTYKLGMLELTGNDPLNPDAWVKSRQPVFTGTKHTYGVGHSCFVRSADGQTLWHVYHAKQDRNPGWRRGIHVQPLTFDAGTGAPDFGQPIAPGIPQPRDVPSGNDLLDESSELLSDPTRWQYFGHHQRYAFDQRGIRLGIQGENHINDFESGEKIVLAEEVAEDLLASVTIDQRTDVQRGAAGILFRVSGPALGYDAHRGYFAGVNIRGGYAMLGKMDGDGFELLRRVDVAMDDQRPVRLCANAAGSKLTVSVNGHEVIHVNDQDYSTGTVGLRVVRTEAHFSELTIESQNNENVATQTERSSQQPTSPNIVLILADDLGWNSVGYHNDEFKTPHIDSIAADGIELNRFYVAPMCSPTRAGLMTGRYPIRFGLARAVIPPYRDFGLPTSETTLPEMLGEIGYQHRGIFGKWHLGHRRAKWHPLARGFTHFHGHYNGAIDYFDLTREDIRDWQDDYEPSDEQGYATDLIADAAANWIKESSPSNSPYFCYVPFNAPHSPFQAPDDAIRLYGDVAGKQRSAKNREIYKAMIGRMDEGIGRILSAVDASGEVDNTIVWFFSDNGGVGGLRGINAPLRGSKLTVFEGGIRVPASVRWPSKISAGQSTDAVCGYIDLVPTLVSLAGGRVSDLADETIDRPIDGVDLSSVVLGKSESLENRPWYSYHGQPGPASECLAVIDAGWKLVVNGPQLNDLGQLRDEAHEVHLFHLSDDVNEATDQAAKFPERVNKLAKQLIEHRALQPKDAIPPYQANRSGFVPPPLWRLDPEHPDELVGQHALDDGR